MDGIEKDVCAIGGLFLTIMSDLRGSSPVWEDFTTKATKLHSSLKTTLIAVAGFLDAFQKVADMATGSRGATKEIGSALTRLCLRHKSIETKLKHLTATIIDNLVVPLQERMEDWKKTVAQLDKEHTKEYKRARQDIKKCAADTVRLQKKVKKGKSDIQSRLDNAMQEVNEKYMLLEEAEKNAVRTALIEERGRFCLFVSSIKPFVDQEVGLLTEITHLQEIMDSLCLQADNPESLPASSEQVIMDLKGLDTKAWSIQTTPPSSPSSLGSRKSSMCSISSITSSSSGSTQSHSPSHNKTIIQPLPLQGLRLTSVSSQDSGFTSQDTLFLRPTTPSSLNIQSQTADNASTGTDTPDVESTPSTPSGSYPNTPSASSTWTNWPNPPNIGNNKTENGRPHTISSAYEKSHHSRPPLTSQLFEPPQQAVSESVVGSAVEQHDAGVVKRERPHSSTSMPYSRPSAAINKMQPVLPPLGPKPKSRAVAPPIVPPLEQPVYANLKQGISSQTTEVLSDSDKTPTAREPHTPNGTAIQYPDELDLKEAIRDLDNYTAALHGDFSRQPGDRKSQMQQNSLELAAAIKELEASTAALNFNYDTASQASQSSLQCSSGYGTMNSTPASSEDTIASGDNDLGQRDYFPPEHEKYFTIPRNSSVYRAAFLQAKRPASTAGVPVSAQGGVLTRRSSLNQPKPPPPVRRSSSITSAPNPAVLQKFRSSPPKQLAPNSSQSQVQSSTSQSNAHQNRQEQKPNHRRSRSASGSEPAYAELTEIQQSIQARYQQQEQYDQSNQYGAYLQTGNSQSLGAGQSSAPVTPQYALPVTIPSTQYSTSVVDSLNAKFAVMNRQNSQNSQSCPQFTPQSDSDTLPPPPPASDDFPDLPPPPSEAELMDIEHTYNVPNVDSSHLCRVQNVEHRQDSQTVELRHPPQTGGPATAPKPPGDMRQSLISEMKKGNKFRKMSNSEGGSEC